MLVLQSLDAEGNGLALAIIPAPSGGDGVETRLVGLALLVLTGRNDPDALTF